MAKQRKAKNEEPKPENSGAVVRHQKICLSIDVNKRQIYGYTELEIVVPDIGIVGLHAENLGVESVFVDGDPAEFEYYPHHAHQQQLATESENRWRGSVSCPSTAADAAGTAYISALERELVPNLLINCCKAYRVSGDHLPSDNMESDDSVQLSDDAKQNVKSVRVNYWVERAESGIHFNGSVLYTDNQIRRARCWFPCIDGELQRWSYDLEFTVAQNFVAVSSGTLLYQVLSKDDPPRKTFVYRLDVPAIPRLISLVVAPFEIHQDPHVGLLSHMCLVENVAKLKYTVEVFHSVFNLYEEYLGSKYPFGSYTQVFLAPEMGIASTSLGASVSFFSCEILYDDNVIDQAIDTSIKLALALAKQWFGVFITSEDPVDEWLVDGLAAFLTDVFIKKFLGSNEARYRRFKANCAVCKADDSGATILSSSASCKNLYGTHGIGVYGKIRDWKSVAVLQMLEKQMGPESFRKILQRVVARAREAIPLRSISTKEFRHFVTKVGNLERPFVKEFFPRWVFSCGCPVLRMGFAYNKRKNLVELAVLRECTAIPDLSSVNLNPDSETRDGDQGWPGMMSIRVHELDGMYDHPALPLAGDVWQLLEISCHSKLQARRFIKPKKGSKPDGLDDTDLVLSTDIRSNLESPLLWIRADPEMEYLADIQFNQPVQMWISQLEKDGDVFAQAQAILALEGLPQHSFAVTNALTNFLNDSKAFWRVRIEAALSLAKSASEETDWAGLVNLVRFYKSRRFDATVGLPKPNEFHDFAEYFVLETIPHAIATVRSSDGRSPREAVEFILQLLKYNDNTGNRYSDVFWLSAIVEAAGELEFSQQTMLFLSPLLKRIDRLLQYDRLMPSYNGILTSSCLRTLGQITLKLSGSVHLVADNVFQLIQQFRDKSTTWQARVEANRTLLHLQFHFKGLDAATTLFITYLKQESSFRGQIKLATHIMRLCHIHVSNNQAIVHTKTLTNLLSLLDSSLAYNNVLLRHYLFCILQTIAGRAPTLYGVPKDKSFNMELISEPKTIFSSLGADLLSLEPPLYMPPHLLSDEHPVSSPKNRQPDTVMGIDLSNFQLIAPEATNSKDEADAVLKPQEQKMQVLKIKVKQSAASSRAETAERSECGNHETSRRGSSSISVDAPPRNSTDAVSVSNQNEEVTSCGGHESRITASIASAKLPSDGDVQCTADSTKMFSQSDMALSIAALPGRSESEVKFQAPSSPRSKMSGEKKRKRDHKSRRDDPEYLEKKRLKKEKKQKKKEMAKLMNAEEEMMKKTSPVITASIQAPFTESKPESTAAPRIRIKIKNKLLSKPET